MHLRKNNTQRGAALLIVIFFFITISLAVIQSATTGAMVELRTYRTIASSKFAYVAAEAGIEDIYYRAATGKSIPSSETIALNGATSTVTVTAVSGSQYDIYSLGSANNNEVRRLYLSISNGKTVTLPYAAQVGEGGISMQDNTTINATGLDKGNIYSDGQVTGVSSVTITGNVISSSGLVPDIYASSTSCTNNEVAGNINPNIDYAQSFMISEASSSPLASVSLYIKRTGNVTGGNIRIVADNSGVPNTSALATQALSYSSVSTSYGWVTVNFTSPPTLNPGSVYWLMLDSTQNATKYWTWCRSNTDTYATGSPKFKQDWSVAGAWTAVTGDMAFTTSFGVGVSKIDGLHIDGLAKADSITNSTITGNAYYKTISGSTVSGSSFPGSPTPPYAVMPISSSTIAQWKTEAAAGGVINGNCGTGGDAACRTFPLTLGPKQINGNFSTNNFNDVTVSGTLYVTGNVSIKDDSTIKCALSYGSGSCLIIADGTITTADRVTYQGSGIDGSYIMLLSTKTGCVGVVASGCTTSNSGISISDNAAGALFYSTDSQIIIYGDAVVTAVAGYKLKTTDNAEILYDSKVSALSVLTSPSGTGAWNVNRWNEY